MIFQRNPCPAGTIGAEIELIREEQCAGCPAGKFCSSPGKSEVTGDCDPGFVYLLFSFYIYLFIKVYLMTVFLD